jgi:hypothetical protein
VSVPPDGVLDLKAFVPAKDLARSTQFYLDLGFKLNFTNEQIAQLEIAGALSVGSRRCALAHHGADAAVTRE